MCKEWLIPNTWVGGGVGVLAVRFLMISGFHIGKIYGDIWCVLIPVFLFFNPLPMLHLQHRQSRRQRCKQQPHRHFPQCLHSPQQQYLFHRFLFKSFSTHTGGIGQQIFTFTKKNLLLAGPGPRKIHNIWKLIEKTRRRRLWQRPKGAALRQVLLFSINFYFCIFLALAWPKK